jgi:hypothetical protein
MKKIKLQRGEKRENIGSSRTPLYFKKKVRVFKVKKIRIFKTGENTNAPIGHPKNLVDWRGCTAS